VREPLQGLNVIVTRPRHQADALLEALASAGAHAISFPTIRIAPRSVTTSPGDDFDAVIFVSVNAVQHGSWVASTRTASAPVIAVGAATAAALLDHGVVAQTPAEANSEGVLAMPAIRALHAGMRVLLVRGVGGRATLPVGLRARSIEVVVAEVYERQCPAVDPAAAARLAEAGFRDHVALATSVETFENLVSLLGTEHTTVLARVGYFAAVSQRIGDHIRATLGGQLHHPVWQLTGAGVHPIVTGLRDNWVHVSAGRTG
tara:strand:+ start:900 stop:1679 length:780 start_codon:yes stop_codon:yes gene_type:complete